MDPETNTALDRLTKSLQTFGSLTMAAESRDKLYRYNEALMQSLYSILEDCDCSEDKKLEAFNTTMEQYATAMKELFPKLIAVKPDSQEKTVGKTADESFDVIEEL